MLHQQQQQQPLQQQQQYYASQPIQALQGRPRGNANGKGKRPGFASRATMVFGIFQIIFGGICVILGITAIVIECELRESGTGIWCGVMFAIAGSFGIAASLKKTNSMIITTMVLSIISATMAGSACITSIIAAVSEERCYQWEGGWYPYYCGTAYGGRAAVDSIMATVALAELVIAILQSAFCCSAYCCNQKPSASTMYIATRSSEGASHGFPMASIQNETTQCMAPSGVEIVPHYPNQQPVPLGYVVNMQPVVTSNQQPSIQMEPQPGVVYQQGQGQQLPQRQSQQRQQMLQLQPQQLQHQVIQPEAIHQRPLWQQLPQQQRQQVPQLYTQQPQHQQMQHQMQQAVQPVAIHQQPLGQQLPQQQHQQVPKLQTQQLQHQPQQSLQYGAVPVDQHQQDRREPQPQPKASLGPPEQLAGEVTGPDVNVNQDQVQSPPTSSSVREDMSAGLVENEVPLA